MATLNLFFPKTGSDADWNSAYYRLEDYFRALHMVNKVHQSQIILRILQAAADRHAQDPAQSPTHLAIEEANLEMDQWFKKALEDTDRAHIVGRLSLFISDAPQKWPAEFMSEEISPEFVRALRESGVQAGPNLQVSSMVPRPLDQSSLVGAMLHDPWKKVEKNSFLLTFAVVGAMAALLRFVLVH